MKKMKKVKSKQLQRYEDYLKKKRFRQSSHFSPGQPVYYQTFHPHSNESFHSHCVESEEDFIDRISKIPNHYLGYKGEKT